MRLRRRMSVSSKVSSRQSTLNCQQLSVSRIEIRNHNRKMGCLNNFVSPDKLLNSGDLEEGDIIEFNRLTYSHFGFYIGDGVCVHATGPDRGMSSSLSAKFKKGVKQTEKLAHIAGYDHRYNKVRVNNCHLLAATLSKRRRSKSEGREVALRGLELDSSGKPILERPIAFNYDLVLNNCEYFATRCRYEGEGFSIQVANPSMNSTLGTVERVTSAIRHDMAEKIMDDDTPVLEKGVAALIYGTHTAAGWTAYAAKTTTDAVAGVASGVMGLFK